MKRGVVAVFLLCLWPGFLIAEADWQRDGRSLLTNFNNMYSPCVVETGGEYRFKMWFFGWATEQLNPGIPGCDAIYHARSKDLQTWEVYSGAGEWDTVFFPHRRVSRPPLFSLASAPGDGHATVLSQQMLSPQELDALAAEPLYVPVYHRRIIHHETTHRAILKYLLE